VKADPTYPQAANNLGLVLQRENRLPEAASEYRRALKADDSYAVARLNLGNVLSLMGQNEAARAELLKLKSLPAGNELRMKAESMLSGLANGSKG